MRKLFALIALTGYFLAPWRTEARPTMAVSGFGGGNFQLTDTFPDLDIGGGGGVAFDYRFNQHWAIATSLSVFSHDGEGASRGDDGMLLLSVPNIDLKFYFFGSEHRIDPYATAGIGINVLTGGSRGDNSGGAGMGAQIGVGADFYLNNWFSLGILTQLHTVGLIRDNSQSSALIFLRATGNFAFHFK